MAMALWTLMKDLLSVASFLRSLLFDKAADDGAGAGLSLAYSAASQVLSVESELGKLRRTVNRIHALLKDAEETRFIEDDAVRLWLAELKGVAFDADDLLDEFQTQISLDKLRNSVAGPSRKRKRPWYSAFPSPLPNWVRSWNISRKIAEIRETYDAIAADRDKLELREGAARRRTQVKEDGLPPEAGPLGGDTPVLGLHAKREEVVGLLCSDGGDGVLGVSIIGVGGIGKTTLAGVVFNDQNVVETFPHRIWVGVSRGFDVKGTTRKIIEAITQNSCDALSLYLLQQQLQQLLHEKRFLLVLDDVWNEDQDFWERLRAPLTAGAKGSRVLVTTRSNMVSRNFRTLHPILLIGLEENECWLLFRNQAFEQGAWVQHQNLVEIGLEIVRKCHGSPLAAKSIGGLLYKKTDEEDWRCLLSDMPHSEDEANNVIMTLKVSYDHLPLHLKQCFAFCSIFPNGYEFDREELVKLWIAVGIVKSRGKRSVENIGGKYFDYLLWRSFFQMSYGCPKTEQRYRMPGLIHELAQSVSRLECLRLEGDVVYGESENARYALSGQNSLQRTMLEKIFQNKKSLRSFILLGENGVPTKQVPDDLLLELRCLRVLDLSNNELTVLPDSIGDLIHLRYLNLHGTNIARLPESVSNLYNLQVLELGGCNKLLELPEGTSNLVNLRHLGLHLDWDQHRNRWSDLISMPFGIGQLTALRTLSRFSVSSENGRQIGELKALNLRGELCISKLENVANARDATEANLKNKQYLEALMLRWSDASCSNAQTGIEEDVIEALRPHVKLKYLWIENCRGSRFPSWLGDQDMSLEKLRISNCKRWADLPLVGKLRNLRFLYLEGLHGLRHLGRVLPDNDGVIAFPLLEMLSISNMSNLESWFEVVEGGMACLRELFISDCSKLSEVSRLPHSLGKVEIKNCRSLCALPMLPSLQNLVVVRGQGTIIDSIRQFTSLSSLTISHLLHLESVPEGCLQDLKLLRTLKIEACGELASLVLKDLVSLESLEISACPELKDFQLQLCNKLTSLPRELHLLSSLQSMMIQMVPMLMSLPAAGLPASLQYLAISGCPMLQQRCRRGGADWHMVQNISTRAIDDISPS